MLTRATAIRVCRIVENDSACRQMLENPGDLGLMNKLGLAGALRNIGNAFSSTFGDMTVEQMQNVSCLGISATTIHAVGAASVNGSARTGKSAALPDISSSVDITRKSTLYGEHHACKVIMMDRSEYVFDWFPTLDAWNPYIYFAEEWRKDGDGNALAVFTGYGDTPDAPSPPDPLPGF
jgi:hypothetical protein